MRKSLKNKRRLSGGSQPQYNWGFAAANSPSEHGFCATEIGTVMMLDEQAYELVGLEGYTRKDGTEGHLLAWKSTCPSCGDEFTATALPGNTWLSRRCSSCKRPGRPVQGKRGRKVQVTVIPA